MLRDVPTRILWANMAMTFLNTCIVVFATPTAKLHEITIGLVNQFKYLYEFIVMKN